MTQYLETINYEGKEIYEEYAIKDIFKKILGKRPKEVSFDMHKNRTQMGVIVASEGIQLPLKGFDKLLEKVKRDVGWSFDFAQTESVTLPVKDKGEYTTLAIVFYFTKMYTKTPKTGGFKRLNFLPNEAKESFKK